MALSINCTLIGPTRDPGLSIGRQGILYSLSKHGTRTFSEILGQVSCTSFF